MTIVQQQDIAALDSMRQLLQDSLRRAIQSVEAAARPACQLQMPMCEKRIQKRIAQSGRRAKESRRLSRYCRYLLLRTLDLFRHGSWTEDTEMIEMAVAVIFDRVTAAYRVADERRVSRDTFADTEERCLCAVFVQHVQHAGSHFRVGPIIDCHSDGASRSSLARQ